MPGSAASGHSRRRHRLSIHIASEGDGLCPVAACGCEPVSGVGLGWFGVTRIGTGLRVGELRSPLALWRRHKARLSLKVRDVSCPAFPKGLLIIALMHVACPCQLARHPRWPLLMGRAGRGRRRCRLHGVGTWAVILSGGSPPGEPSRSHKLALLSLRALPITETELRLIAKAAIIGLRSRPVNG